ncbi:hypothetical protein HU200_036326 [Digitaria exilis]|uniref:RNase H type-1 domain-containing protein n=1 Tax=Digitaria exilis TaxID=1010633 RepID=A0A835BD92_9POAL|nr:hypothetical protein HU200_036326 [Digitaria exilis]
MGIYDGVQALLAMRSSLELINEGGRENTRKKGAVQQQELDNNRGKEKAMSSKKVRWELPPQDWCKVNVDGSFVESNGTAGVGVIARNSMGQVIFTAWRVLWICADAAEAEARACVEDRIPLPLEKLRRE